MEDEGDDSEDSTRDERAETRRTWCTGWLEPIWSVQDCEERLVVHCPRPCQVIDPTNTDTMSTERPSTRTPFHHKLSVIKSALLQLAKKGDKAYPLEAHSPLYPPPQPASGSAPARAGGRRGPRAGSRPCRVCRRARRLLCTLYITIQCLVVSPQI